MTCKVCGSEMSIFYEQESVPAHSVLRFPTRKKAIEHPHGTILLGFCAVCGFISNLAWESRFMRYSPDYNPTQIHSETFNTFHEHLALHLIEKYNLENKLIFEIGCGDGKFLELICELGRNRGIGLDPACEKESTDTITYIQDFYSEKYAAYTVDCVCCKMTLEHISDVMEFIASLKQIMNTQTVVFIQVPDVTRILNDLAFWDIYYEHCSYFSSGSLVRIFRKNGFKILDVWQDFKDQYVMIGAQIGSNGLMPDDLYNLKQGVEYFRRHCQQNIDAWRKRLEDGRKTVVWGGGSKGVAFINNLKMSDHIDYVVDIDPLKQDTFLAGTGHQIVSPDFLKTYFPDRIIIMNSIYKKEIQHQLNHLDLYPEILTLS